MSKYCKNCGKSISDNAAFCPKCGNKVDVDEEWCCKKCGTLNDSEALFCQKCGYKKNSEKTKKMVLGLLIAVAVIAVGLVGGYLYFQHQAEQEKIADDKRAQEVLDNMHIGSDPIFSLMMKDTKAEIAMLDVRSIQFDNLTFNLLTNFREVEHSDDKITFSSGKNLVAVEVKDKEPFLEEYSSIGSIYLKDEGTVKDIVKSYVQRLAESRNAKIYIKKNHGNKIGNTSAYLTAYDIKIGNLERQSAYTYMIIDSRKSYYVTIFTEYDETAENEPAYYWALGVLDSLRIN